MTVEVLGAASRHTIRHVPTCPYMPRFTRQYAASSIIWKSDISAHKLLKTNMTIKNRFGINSISSVYLLGAHTVWNHALSNWRLVSKKLSAGSKSMHSYMLLNIFVNRPPIEFKISVLPIKNSRLEKTFCANFFRGRVQKETRKNTFNLYHCPFAEICQMSADKAVVDSFPLAFRRPKKQVGRSAPEAMRFIACHPSFIFLLCSDKLYTPSYSTYSAVIW